MASRKERHPGMNSSQYMVITWIRADCACPGRISFRSKHRDELIDIPGWKVPYKRAPPGRKTRKLKARAGRIRSRGMSLSRIGLRRLSSRVSEVNPPM